MTEIQQNRYDQLLRRVNNIVAPGSMVGDALNELFPTIDVETRNVELAFLSGWRLAFSSTNQGATVGNNNLVQLFNPAGSGLLVVPTLVTVSSRSLQLIEYGLSTTPLTDFTANVAVRDTRTGILQPVVAQLRSVTQVGSIATFGQFFVEADVAQTLQSDAGLFMLAPGTGLTFSTTVQNSEFQTNWLWRERNAEPAELNF